MEDSVLNEWLLKNGRPYQHISKNVQDVHEHFLNLTNIEWKIKKTPVENHGVLYFQPTFVVLHIHNFLLVYLQSNTTMKFPQKFDSYSTTCEIWEFLIWHEIFSYEYLFLARDRPEIGNSVYSLAMVQLHKWRLARSFEASDYEDDRSNVNKK